MGRRGSCPPRTAHYPRISPKPLRHAARNLRLPINGQGYVMGGGYENWRFDPALDIGTPMAFFAEREGGSAFVINGVGYYGTGAGYPGTGFLNVDLWQFQP